MVMSFIIIVVPGFGEDFDLPVETAPSEFPDIIYPTSFESKKLFDYGVSSYSTQGMCSDKKRYLWVSYKRSDKKNTTIVKYDLEKDEVIDAITERSYGHINDMCYVADTHEIWIISWVTNDMVWYENGGTLDRISVVDADTLLFKREFGLKSILGEHVEYPSLSAITYNPHYKWFAGVTREHEIGGIAKKEYVIWNLENEYIKSISTTGHTVTSGMDCDDHMIYCLFGYCLYYVDWETLKEISYTTEQVLDDANRKYGAIQEAESICVIGLTYYVNANNFAVKKEDNNIPRVRVYEVHAKTIQ